MEVHGSKQMVYDVYGPYVEGVEEDVKHIRRYLMGESAVAGGGESAVG